MIGSERKFQHGLLRWYDAHRRELPWRRRAGASDRLDPYHVLVSEAMLQQTQVATVVPYFGRFLERFPTMESLAAAAEQDVLRLWQGLGYYSRARNLQRAARTVVGELNGRMPQTAEELRRLPGVGRYTAGAVASIAFDARSPIVDGNVARVLCRLDRIEHDPREKQTQDRLWQRAEAILPRSRCGDFNSALMELGATVCAPRVPKCLICPVRDHCEAQAAGMQERIPPPRLRKRTPLLRRAVLCIRHGERYLIEQRPARGRWAGMWQFITIDACATRELPGRAAAAVGGSIMRLRRLGIIRHALTHRRYEFSVYAGMKHGKAGDAVETAAAGKRAWVTLEQIDHYPLPRPHVKVAHLLDLRRDYARKRKAGPRGPA